MGIIDRYLSCVARATPEGEVALLDLAMRELAQLDRAGLLAALVSLGPAPDRALTASQMLGLLRLRIWRQRLGRIAPRAAEGEAA